MKKAANDASEPAWDLSVTFRLSNARVIATLKKGGAIFEDGLSLLIEDGRVQSWHERKSALVYMCQFSVADAPEPEKVENVKGQIVITGTHENGQSIEIRGRGWIGRDNNGNIDGIFDDPPKMLIRIDDD